MAIVYKIILDEESNGRRMTNGALIQEPVPAASAWQGAEISPPRFSKAFPKRWHWSDGPLGEEIYSSLKCARRFGRQRSRARSLCQRTAVQHGSWPLWWSIALVTARSLASPPTAPKEKRSQTK